MDRERRREQYEQTTQWPMIALAVLFVAAYAWRVLGVGLPGWAETALGLVAVAVWPVFLVDYLVRLALAEHRWRFVRANWIDGVAVALPLLRPLRIIGLVRVARVIDRRLATDLHGRVAGYVTVSASLVVFMAALAVLDAERGAQDANITGFGDALWWAVTTITTVGYGDRYPVTGEGRVVAVLLMLAGIALLGVVTAAVASWFVDRVSDARDDEADDLRSEVRDLAAEVRALRAELAGRELTPGA